MVESEHDDDLAQDIAEEEHRAREMAYLFGNEIVKQAKLIDVATLDLNEEIVRCIADGVRELKQLRGRPEAQVNYVRELQSGTKLLLCMWIMDMNLLDSIQDRSYLC